MTTLARNNKTAPLPLIATSREKDSYLSLSLVLLALSFSSGPPFILSFFLSARRPVSGETGEMLLSICQSDLPKLLRRF